MNRRSFLRDIGLAPLIPLLARIKPEPASFDPFSKIYFFQGFSFIRTQLPDPKIEGPRKFEESLEEQGLLAFTEHIDFIESSSAMQVRHVADAEPLERATWVDSSEFTNEMLDKIRTNTRTSLRRYWAQQIRWRRKAQLSLAKSPYAIAP